MTGKGEGTGDGNDDCCLIMVSVTMSHSKSESLKTVTNSVGLKSDITVGKGPRGRRPGKPMKWHQTNIVENCR